MSFRFGKIRVTAEEEWNYIGQIMPVMDEYIEAYMRDSAPFFVNGMRNRLDQTWALFTDEQRLGRRYLYQEWRECLSRKLES